MANHNPIIGSAVWAAYGDALGFITELSDPKSLTWRTGSNRVEELSNWRRKIGGRYGVEVTFSRGAYSDDTQLRLATSRAIRGDGYFDVESFAKIELPVWLNYSLGAGRGSKAAARALTANRTNWFSNFFSVANGPKYVNCGGNGAAMRIQPHVWSRSVESDEQQMLRDVIRNSVTTHGHIRGIAGAAMHATWLRSVISNLAPLSPDELRDSVQSLTSIADLIKSDEVLGPIWLRQWEKESAQSIDQAVASVIDECHADISAIGGISEKSLADSYRKALVSIGGTKPESRGSGTKTVILASYLSWLFRAESPKKAFVCAVNELDSDTDTICTMAGALMGTWSEEMPAVEVVDQDYIKREASRLARIGSGEKVSSFGYPDVSSWKAPKAQQDALGRVGSELQLAGIGKVISEGEKFEKKGNTDSAWQWLGLDFGQTVLSKRRKTLKTLPENARPVGLQPAKPSSGGVTTKSGDLFGNGEERKGGVQISLDIPTLDALTSEAIASGFNEEVMGHHLQLLWRLEDGIEKAIAYSAIVGKAVQARRKAGKIS